MPPPPSEITASPYRRVVLKLSGDSFAKAGERGITMDEVLGIGEEVVRAATSGTQMAIVVGGGNVLRGSQFISANQWMQEATAHYMGMLATIINGQALQEAIESLDVTTRLMSTLEVHKVAEPFIRRRALRHLEKGRIIILAGGTGAPFVTTDTAAAQKALELDADIVLKATRVDGVFSDDPENNPHAVLYRELTFDEVRQKKLRVMDQTAFAHCSEHDLPILVFNYRENGNIERAVRGERIGTIVRNRH